MTFRRSLPRAAVRSGALLAAASTAHLLANRPRPVPADPPAAAEPVSVLVPARDEAARIAPTVRALLAQTGVPDLEVLVLDDGSTDGTAEVVRAAAGGDARLRVVAGSPPPPGWLGKPHACAQLAAAARGLPVFVDADVVLAPHAVASAVAVLRGHGGGGAVDLLCPWPRPLADGLLPRLVQPLGPWSWMATLPLRRAERSHRPSTAVANGQFLLVDAVALEKAGGFEAVAGEVLDDIALARAVKRSGGRAAVADGSTLAACRMYTSGAELAAGYGKSLWAAFGPPASSSAVAALLAWVFVLPPLAALAGSRAGLAGYAAAVAGRAVAARRLGTPPWPDALAHPASVTALLVLLARSWAGRRRGTLSWKGRAL